MARALLLAALAAATVLTAPAAEAQQRRGRAAAAQDWTRVAARTPEGGFRMGNPNARLKLVEYLSLTCPHCAEFSHQGSAGLLAAVRTGRVSVEYRNYILNGIDVAAAMLVRCATPVNYFAMTHNLLGSQPGWLGRVRTIPEQTRQELGALQPLQVAERLVPLLGLDTVAQRYGLGPAARRQCLTQANLDRLNQLYQAAVAAGVSSTPTFFLNGRRLDVNTWAGVEPLLRG